MVIIFVKIKCTFLGKMEQKSPNFALLGHDPKFFKMNGKTPVEIKGVSTSLSQTLSTQMLKYNLL